ncbi:GNAT family N-acetyltransferase [Curvivirga sp.]|uniref:GNAT family N-acetyltransferase n=1 Tax=Curvivirga sp. TaxID=2856848 RepID=UPI003B5922B2
MSKKINIRPCETKDKSSWRALYDGYATFYNAEMTDEMADRVWNWIQDTEHDLKCILAVCDNEIVGLAHYRPMLRPLRSCYIGYLDDIFVSPKARGLKVADALMAELKVICKENGWSVMRWLTADDNYRARGLYDRHAVKSHSNLYELTLEN